MRNVIISVLAPDRPGILAAVSKALLDQGGNIQNVSQTILHSVFSGLLMVTLPDDLDDEQLAKALEARIGDPRLHIFVRSPAWAVGDYEPPRSQPFVITTLGPDRPGLVAGITRVLARHAVNVTSMRAAFKGGSLPANNVMIFEVDVPEAVSLPALYRDLKDTGAELELEVNIQHRKLFEMLNRI